MTRYFRSRFVNISNNQIYAALDIGSGKISCLIAKINNSGQIEIIGAGHQESKGLSVGTITDLKELESAIRKCVESAEKMASETVKSVILVPKLEPYVSDYINNEYISGIGLGILVYILVLFVLREKDC